MTVALLTNWWNHPELIGGYMDAVAGEAWDELIVMDNASEPHTARDLAAMLPRVGARVIRREQNSQIAASWQAAQETTAAVLAFVNNDIVKMRAGWLERLCAGVRPGQVRCQAIRTEQGIRYPDGWCWAIHRQDWERLGGYDVDFEEPPYWADVYLAYRMTKAGIAIESVDVGLRHLESRSANPLKARAAFWETFERNRQRMRDKIAAAEGVTP